MHHHRKKAIMSKLKYIGGPQYNFRKSQIEGEVGAKESTKERIQLPRHIRIDIKYVLLRMAQDK